MPGGTYAKYQINLGTGFSGPEFTPVGMWLDVTDTTYGAEGKPRPVSQMWPQPVADANAASYADWPALAAAGNGVTTVPAGTRALAMNVTAAGTLTVTSAAGNAMTFPVVTGFQVLPFVPASFSMTATATVWGVR